MVKEISSIKSFRVGWVRKIPFVASGKVILTRGGINSKICDLYFDRNIIFRDADQIRSWLRQSPSDRGSSVNISQFEDLILKEEVSKLMDIDVIAVSPSFKRSFLDVKRKLLALKLSDALRKAREFETRDANRILQNEVRTLFLEDDGVVGRPVSAGGTILDTGYQFSAGGRLFALAAENFFPLPTDQVFEKDNFGFYDWLVNNIGRKREVIGSYVLELALVRELFRRKEIDSSSPVLSRIKLAFREGKGYWMKMELRNLNSSSVEEFEKEIDQRISKVCRKLFKKFNKINTLPKVDSQGLAILTLMVALGRLRQETVINFLKKGVPHPAVNLLRILEEVNNYLATEDKRIFSLSRVIEVIKGGSNA